MFFHIGCADRTAQIALRHEAPRVWACGVRNLCQERGDGPVAGSTQWQGLRSFPRQNPNMGTPNMGS